MSDSLAFGYLPELMLSITKKVMLSIIFPHIYINRTKESLIHKGLGRVAESDAVIVNHYVLLDNISQYGRF